MQKLWSLMVVACLVLVYSCAKDKAAKPTSIDCANVNVDSNTYTLKVKQIFDASCTPGCHDALYYTFSGNVKLDTYQDVVNTFNTKDVLCTIKQEQGCVAMPDGQPKLADSLITYIQCWSENGFKQ